MKAWFYTEYGGPEVLRFDSLPDPEPKKGEVLIRVRATGLNAADWHIMRADPALVRPVAGLRKPRKPMLLGSDIAGEVVANGEGATRFKPGDAVMAEVMMMGGCGELAAVPEERIARIPEGLSFEQAAAIPMAGCTALQGVRDGGRLLPGQSVLVLGASGGVGTFAVQIARALGGTVTGACSTDAVELVHSLGASHVIDYTKGSAVDAGITYDLVINIGGHATLRQLRRTLTPRGTLAVIGASGHGGLLGPGALSFRAALVSPFVRQRLVMVSATAKHADLETLSTMIEAGEIAPVMDRIYPLAEGPDALRYLENEHPRGKVVITL